MPVYTVERRDYYIIEKEIEADTLKEAFEKLEKDDYFLSSRKGWCDSEFYLEDEEGKQHKA